MGWNVKNSNSECSLHIKFNTNPSKRFGRRNLRSEGQILAERHAEH